MVWRSKDILQPPEWSLGRALYKAMGYSDYDLSRPLIGVANSWNRVVPGHYNLRLVSDYVKQGIFQAGGTPVEFGVIAACDGIAQGHDGMHYILPTRDLIANDVEMMIGAHRLDGVVLLGSCDKIVPGMMMASARMDIPATGHAENREDERGRVPKPGKLRRAGVWVLLVFRNGQHHVLPGRG
ncbi:MAG: dihydroxy-acid dehydratase, partial [Deltaproteobacteria bacterium]|nr:dihydroxy-acid dehydratase [Deltaproteobacteria bacterium]